MTTIPMTLTESYTKKQIMCFIKNVPMFVSTMLLSTSYHIHGNKDMGGGEGIYSMHLWRLSLHWDFPQAFGIA